jgi:hypothetical protein
VAGAADEEIALLRVHVKAGARAFLDQSYDAFMSAGSYGEPPVVEVLEKAWDEYARRYDVDRRPRADPYQKFLLDYGPHLDDVLRWSGREPELRARLRSVQAFVPQADLPLVTTALSVMDGDMVAAAHDVGEPDSMLHALRYVRGRVAECLAVACILARRFGIDARDAARLPLLTYAVNHGYGAEQVAAWKGLVDVDRAFLARLVNAFWEHGDDQHLAMCAMRTVGDPRSVGLIMARIPMPTEGTVQMGDGPVEPAWDEVRRDVRASVAERHGWPKSG